jgi:tetratricopeptide (TPR) repeat protein
MNRQVLVLAIIVVLICGPAKATAGDPESTHCAQITAWVMGGVSSQRAMQIISENPITFSPSVKDVSGLPALQPERATLNPASGCTKAIESGAQLLRSKRYEDAERVLHRLLTGDSRDAAIHFALGALRQMQGDWDGAFDEFSESKRLLPGLPETHNRLAWNFYHSDDGENAIAEARTALSIDPRNAEAYRFLGLGFYSNGMLEAALHAFEQSLLLEPENRDTFLRHRPDASGSES